MLRILETGGEFWLNNYQELIKPGSGDFDDLRPL